MKYSIIVNFEYDDDEDDDEPIIWEDDTTLGC